MEAKQGQTCGVPPAPSQGGPRVIAAQLRSVNNLIFRKMNSYSKQNGVGDMTPMHAWILWHLYNHQEEEIYQRDIERVFSITRSTVTNILQLMERKGYIQRCSVPQDARLKQLIITQEGIDAHQRMMLSLRQTDAFISGLLSEEENAEMLRLLDKLRQGLE